MKKKFKREPETVESVIANCLIVGTFGIALLLFPGIRAELKKALEAKST